jgi:alpha-tubulin suppressor-like RCC1 family protein
MFCGYHSTFIVSEDYTVYLAGNDLREQLKLKGSTFSKNNTLMQLDIKYKVVSVASGHCHILILDTNNCVYSLGENNYGQLGLGDFIDRKELELVPVLDVKFITCSKYNSYIIDANNVAYSCGPLNKRSQFTGNYGQLGLGEINDLATFTPILSDVGVEFIACSDEHAILVTDNGLVYTFGSNYAGQLGIGNTKSSFTPILIQNYCDIVTAACGASHSMIVDKYGNVYSAGGNSSGQLGLGDCVYSDVFMAVPITDIISAACGAGHTLLLDSNGYVYSCGRNDYGQLGRGYRYEKFYTFGVIQHEQKMTHIACGNNHSIISNGQYFYSFGDNYSCKLGARMANNGSAHNLIPTTFNIYQPNQKLIKNANK